MAANGSNAPDPFPSETRLRRPTRCLNAVRLSSGRRPGALDTNHRVKAGSTTRSPSSAGPQTRRCTGRMRLDWALLANAAEGPPNGLVYILGAGIDTLWREQFPAPFGGALVLRLLSSRIEADRGHKIEVHCVDEDGRPILNQPLVLNLPA